MSVNDATRAPAHPVQWQAWLAAAVIIMAGFGVYAGCLGAPFVFDDIPGVTQNQSIRSLRDIRRVLLPPAEGSGVDSRPLVNLSLAVNYAINGQDVRGYRLTNIAIHVLGGLALFGLVRRTLALPETPERWRRNALPAGFCVALLWTVHPLQTETVISIIQRTESLMSLCYLVALYCFARAVAPGGHRLWLWAAWGACLAGMTAKEVMASAPLILFLYDRTFGAGSFQAAWRQRGRWHAAFAGTWLLLAALVIHSGGDRGGTTGFGQGVSPWTYLLTQARALSLYLKLSFWPHPLVVDYGAWLAPSLRVVFWEAVLVVSLLGLAVWAVARRPRLGFGGLAFFAVLAPSSSFYPLVSQTIAEHRMHLPLAAVLTLTVLGLFRMPVRPALAVCLLAAVAAAWGTVRRGDDYASELTLWTDNVKKTPSNGWARYSLALVLMRENRLAEAERECRAVVTLLPAHVGAHFTLGQILERQGRLEEAAASFQRAQTSMPASADAFFRHGLVLLKLGRPAEALPAFAEAVRLKPDHADAEGNWGAALLQLGKAAEALPHFERVLTLKPDSVEARYNLALLFLQLGRPREALPHLEQAAALRPQDAEIQSILQQTRAQLD